MLNKIDYEKFFWSVEGKHFWFKGRVNLIKQNIPKNAIKILDVGCASGGSLKNFNLKYDVYGIDLSKEAINKAKKRGLKNVFVANAKKLPFEDESFDVVYCSDLLEHVKEDNVVLEEIYRVLKKRGIAIIGVPAFKCLWTGFDEINNHYRRYTFKDFKELINCTNFRIRRFSFWNFFLFLPVLFVRILKNLKILKSHNDIKMPPKFINNFLSKIIYFENFLISRGFKFPFGISLIAILEKP